MFAKTQSKLIVKNSKLASITRLFSTSVLRAILKSTFKIECLFTSAKKDQDLGINLFLKSPRSLGELILDSIHFPGDKCFYNAI